MLHYDYYEIHPFSFLSVMVKFIHCVLRCRCVMCMMSDNIIIADAKCVRCVLCAVYTVWLGRYHHSCIVYSLLCQPADTNTDIYIRLSIDPTHCTLLAHVSGYVISEGGLVLVLAVSCVTLVSWTCLGGGMLWMFYILVLHERGKC